MLFFLLLALHDEEGRSIFDDTQKKQRKKYLTFPSQRQIDEAAKKKQGGGSRRTNTTTGRNSVGTVGDTSLPRSAFPFKKDQHFRKDSKLANPFPRDESSVAHVMEHLCRHGFGFILEEDLDGLQLERLMVECWKIIGQKAYPNDYPTQTLLNKHPNIASDPIYEGMHESHSTKLEESLMEGYYRERLRTAFGPRQVTPVRSFQPRTLDPYQHSQTVSGVTKKHHRTKPESPGNTSCILGDSRLFLPYLEYVLVTHHRLEFQSNGSPRLRSVSFDRVTRCLFVKERIPYPVDKVIPPRTRSAEAKRNHTIMVVLPRSEWAMLFINWTKEVMAKNEVSSLASNGDVVRQLELLH